MNPYKPNRGVPEVQETLDQGNALAQVCREGSPSRPGANIQVGVVETSEGLLRTLDAALALLSDEGRRHVASILLPRVRQLLAVLEGSCGAGSDDTTESPCDSCSRKSSSREPCAHQNRQKAKSSTQASEVELTKARQAPSALAASYVPSVPIPASGRYVRVATTNGHRLGEEEFRQLAEDGCDIILDTTNHVLKYRRDPARHTPLVSSSLKGIGSERLKVLAFMLEYPTRRICSDTLPPLLGEPDEIMEPEALAQTILQLRKALGAPGKQNPYILTEPAWGESRRRGVGVYVLNSKWKYLLIQWESEITRKS